jgi:hypothetical protein
MVLTLDLNGTLPIAKRNLRGFIDTVGLGQRLNRGGVPFFIELGHDASLDPHVRWVETNFNGAARH